MQKSITKCNTLNLEIDGLPQQKTTQATTAGAIPAALDGRLRIWRKQHESTNPSCIASKVQAAAEGVIVFS